MCDKLSVLSLKRGSLNTCKFPSPVGWVVFSKLLTLRVSHLISEWNNSHRIVGRLSYIHVKCMIIEEVLESLLSSFPIRHQEMPDCTLHLLELTADVKALIIVQEPQEDMNTGECSCFAHLYDSMLLDSSLRGKSIFNVWQQHAPAYCSRFALWVLYHGAFNQWEIINALRTLLDYSWVPMFSDLCKQASASPHSLISSSSVIN